MKFLIALVALIAVAAASPVNKPNDSDLAQLESIMAAIQSPSTDPATAALLEQQLNAIMASFIEPSPIAVGPAIVEGTQPISVAPVNKPSDSDLAQLESILAAIQSPSTDPATAALLEQQLNEIMASFIEPSPIAVGPAIVEGTQPISVGPAIVEGTQPISVGPAIVEGTQPISVGPAIIDFPIPDGGAITEVANPSPVVVGPSPAPGAVIETPTGALVQIILNINSDSNHAAPVAVDAPVASPVSVVETAAEPVSVIDTAPEAVSVVEVAENIPAPSPITVVEAAPEVISVVNPIFTAPAITLPEILN